MNKNTCLTIFIDYILWSGLAYNMATSGGTGGNTTTGQSARLFYQNPDVRERLVELCPQEFRETFREILFYSK